MYRWQFQKNMWVAEDYYIGVLTFIMMSCSISLNLFTFYMFGVTWDRRENKMVILENGLHKLL